MENEKFYKRIDSESGLIKKDTEKNHYVVLQKEQIIRNMLLGEYDSTGNYIVNPEIINELVAMPKYFVEEYDSIYLVKGTYKADKFFYFSVSFGENTATLNLLEKINFGSNLKPDIASYSNIITTKLLSVEIDNPHENLDEVYKKFNISKEPADKIKDFSELSDEERAALVNLLYKVKFNYVRNTLWLKKEKERELSEAEYFDSVVNLLYNLPEFGTSVLLDLDKEFVTKKDLIKFENLFFFLSINDMLNAFIEKNKNKINEKDYLEFLKQYKDIQKKYIEQKIGQLDIEVVEEELNKSFAELKYENLFNRQLLKDKKKLAEFANLVALNKYFKKLEERGVDLFGKTKKSQNVINQTKPLSKLMTKSKIKEKSKDKKLAPKTKLATASKKPAYLTETLQKFSYSKSEKASTSARVENRLGSKLLNSLINVKIKENVVAPTIAEPNPETNKTNLEQKAPELKVVKDITNTDGF